MSSTLPGNPSSLLAAPQFGDGVLRWSSTPGRQEFVALNSAGAGITLYSATGNINPHEFDFEELSGHSSYPAFSTYDWSPNIPGLIAVGTKEGTISLLRVDDGANASIGLPLKPGRSCLTVSFNTTGLLAVGLDRIRNDQCLQIWDVNQRLSGWEVSKPGWQFSSTSPKAEDQTPLYKLEANVPVTSARFFEDNPQIVVAGVRNTRISIHDLRDPASAVLSFQTRNSSNLAIDSRDTNYFASSPLDKPHITVWDRRVGTRSNASKTYCDAVEASGMSWGCALSLSKAIDVEKNASIKQLRYSRDRRGLLGVLSSTGELQTLQLGRQFVDEEERLANSPELLQVHKSCVLEYSWGHESFGKPPNTRIDSFDWVRMNDDNHTPRVIYRRFDASLGIAVEPSIGTGKLFDVLNIQSNKMKVDHLTMPDFDTASETMDVYGPIAAQQLGLDFAFAKMQAGTVLEDGVSQPDIRTSVDAQTLIKSAKATYNLISWKHRDLARNAEQLRRQLKEVKVSVQDEAEAGSIKHIYPASRDRHWQHFREDIDREETDASYGVLSNIIRRRCVQGYLFDCAKNQNLAKQNPWLQDMWAWIEGAQIAAESGDMMSEHLDLSYMGVVSVWNNDLGVNAKARQLKPAGQIQDQDWDVTTKDIIRRHERANFNGVDTSKPHHRQLCLKICGWGKTLEELDQDLQRFEAKGQFTKAAVWALCERQPQRAVEALQRGGGNLVLVALALKVQIGNMGKLANVDTHWDTILEQNRELFDDPYLRAVYALISTGDWKLIVREDSMPLRERVGIAIRHLPDTDLTEWLLQELRIAIETGDIEGIVLAGLTDKMADIMSSYVRESGDFQTATLALSFTIPHYFEDVRYNQWRAVYRQYQNGHKLHVRRALFDSSHAKLARLRGGKSAINPPPRQITLRCVHCSTSLPNDLRNTNMASDQGPAPTRVSASDNRNALLVAGINGGICCPSCGKHLPRCALCLQTLGVPRCDLQAANPQTDHLTQPGTAEDLQYQREQAQRNFFTFCMKCPHAMHADHALQWFSRHIECPVADCQCQCYAEESARRKDGVVVKEFEKAMSDKDKQKVDHRSV